MPEINQRTVLVTGASSGIGAEIAKAFFQENCQLVLADANPPEDLSHFAEREQDVCFVQGDLAEEATCREIVQQGISRFGASLIAPQEISALALFLCSETARSITGASWNIDCGWTAQ